MNEIIKEKLIAGTLSVKELEYYIEEVKREGYYIGKKEGYDEGWSEGYKEAHEERDDQDRYDINR